jgi:hypothetical protein
LLKAWTPPPPKITRAESEQNTREKAPLENAELP